MSRKPAIALQMADLPVDSLTGCQSCHVNYVYSEIDVSLHTSVPVRVSDLVEMLRLHQLVVLQRYGSRFAIDVEGRRSFREAVDSDESWAW